MLKNNNAPATVESDFDLTTLNTNVNVHMIDPANISRACFNGAIAATVGYLATRCIAKMIDDKLYTISMRRAAKKVMNNGTTKVYDAPEDGADYTEV